MALRRNIHSFRFALNGIRIAWREEVNFRIQLAAAVAAIVLGFALEISPLEWLIVIFLIGFVLASEALNTALEELCDMLQSNPDPHIAKIKDLAAAAVLISSATAALIGAIIFLPKLF